MKLFVKQYLHDKWPNCYFDMHEAVDEDGITHNVDLRVSGELPTPEGMTHEEFSRSLVGKTIECESIWPTTEVADGLRIVTVTPDHVEQEG